MFIKRELISIDHLSILIKLISIERHQHIIFTNGNANNKTHECNEASFILVLNFRFWGDMNDRLEETL